MSRRPVVAARERGFRVVHWRVITFPRGLRALNHPEYRRFFLAQFAALTGSWMQTVAQSWLVLQLTDSPLKLGLLGTMQFAPILLLSLVSGVVADRVARRRLLLATQITMALQALALTALVWTGAVEYWHVGAMALVAGLAQTLDQPARQSFVAEMVGKDDMINAVALNSASFNAARIVGPAIAGVLIARFGIAPAFLINSAGFAIVVAVLLSLRAGEGPGRRRDTTVLEEIREGIAYALRTPTIRLVLLLLLVVSYCVFNFTVYVPLLAKTVLRLGPEGFGLLMAALGVGAVSGALTVGTIGSRHPRARDMFAAAAVACCGLVAMSAVRHVWLAALVLFAIGFSGILMVASGNTAMQLSAPDALRGRVMSLYTLVWGGIFPVSAFMVGAISERWGVSIAFLVNGVAGLGALALAALWWRRRAPAP
jgi:predicted MFS family arabinose efflux permease